MREWVQINQIMGDEEEQNIFVEFYLVACSVYSCIFYNYEQQSIIFFIKNYNNNTIPKLTLSIKNKLMYSLQWLIFFRMFFNTVITVAAAA